MSATKIDEKNISPEMELQRNLDTYEKFFSSNTKRGIQKITEKNKKKLTKEDFKEKERLEKYFKDISTSRSADKFKFIKLVNENRKYKKIKLLSDLVRKAQKVITYTRITNKEVEDILRGEDMSNEDISQLVKNMNSDLQDFTSSLDACSDMTRKFNKLVELDAVDIPDEINELIDAYGFYSAVKFMGDDVKVSQEDYKRNKQKLEYLMRIISNQDEFFTKINDKIYKKSYYELNILKEMLKYRDITEYRRYKELSSNSALYKKYSEYLYSGRRKLIISDFFSIFHFLTSMSEIRKSKAYNNVIIYAGSSPGSHIPLIMESFGSKISKFLLFDTSPVSENLKKYIEDQKEQKVIHHSAYLERSHIETILKTYSKNTNILLLSDIRTTDSGKVGNKEIINDMNLQKTFFEAIKPYMAVFKFKLPYPEKDKSPTFQYYSGDIFLQSWTKPFSSETRLILTSESKLIDYSLEEYEKKMFFFNTDIRIQRYTFEEFKRERINMYDFVAEMFILNKIANVYGERGITGMQIHEEINKLFSDKKLKPDIENDEYKSFREDIENFLESSPKAPIEILEDGKFYPLGGEKEDEKEDEKEEVYVEPEFEKESEEEKENEEDEEEEIVVIDENGLIEEELVFENEAQKEEDGNEDELNERTDYANERENVYEDGQEDRHEDEN